MHDPMDWPPFPQEQFIALGAVVVVLLIAVAIAAGAIGWWLLS